MFRLSLSTLLFGLVLSATAVCGEEDPEGLSCPEHQQAFEGSCYEFVHLQQSFLSSQSWCERGGGHLAFVQNDETQQFLQRHLQPEQNWWLGLAPAFFNLSLDFMEAPLSWLDGSNVSYSNWLGDPVPDTDCGYISASGFQWVTTTNCSQEFYFICQFELGHSLVCPDYNVTLQCDYGYVIQIDHSFYGRKTPYYCQVNESVSPTPFKEECTWVDVGDLISAFCGGLGVCEVATNTSFGEPCPVLGSYLSIKYHCTNVTGHGNSSTTDDNSSWTHHDRSSASDTSSPKIQDPGETPGSAYLERQLHENQISPIDTNSPRTPAPRTTPNDINHGRDSEHDHTPSTDIHSPRTPAPKTTPSDTNHGRDHENDHTPSTDHSPKTPAPKTTPSDTNHGRDHEHDHTPSTDHSPKTPAPRTTPNDINHGRDSEHDHTPSTDIHSPRTPAPKTTPSDINHGRDHEHDHTPSTDIHSPRTPAPRTTPSHTNHGRDHEHDHTPSSDHSPRTPAPRTTPNDINHGRDHEHDHTPSTDIHSPRTPAPRTTPSHTNHGRDHEHDHTPSSDHSPRTPAPRTTPNDINHGRDHEHDHTPSTDIHSPRTPAPRTTPSDTNHSRDHEHDHTPSSDHSPRTPAPRTTPNNINHGRDHEHDHTPSTDIHSPRNPAPRTTPNDINHGRDHENDHTPSTDHSPKTPAPRTPENGSGAHHGHTSPTTKYVSTAHLVIPIPDTTTAQLSCAIDPPMGDVLTPFQITCTTVKPFCCSGSCLFCLATFEGDFVLCGSDLGMKFLFLPLGNKSNHYSLGLKVTVKNVDGQAISTALFTQVIDISCDSTVQDLQSVVLNYVTQLQHNGQFSATALAPLFLSVSNSLNRDLNDDLMKSARRKLREVLLADMCAALTYGEPLTFLTEVQMTASTVLSLVTAGDELTYNAQVQACCVLMSISKSQISMLSDGENATVQIIQTAATIVQATSNILQASTNTEQDGITSLVFSILDNVQSSLLTNKEPDQEPIFFSFPPISLYVNRLSPGELPNQTFSFGNRSLAAFTLPPLISNVLPSEKVVDVRMLSFEQNPFSTNKGLPINGTVGSLSITRVNGSVIPVSNLNEEIEILLPLVVAVHLNSTHLDLRNYSTLAINMTTGNTSLVLKLDPSSNISLQLLLGFQMYPNDTNYKAKLQLPQAGKSTEERYTWVLGPRDIALEEGVYYLLVRPVVGAGVNSSNASVFVTSIAAHCLYWDETKTNWSDYGCRVGPRTSASVTQCLCTHLTFFGSSFFVMPNKVDVSRTAELFATFFNNPVVVCFVGAVFLVYILVVIWARWKDLQDKIKVKIMVLEDNDPLSEYRYLLTVSTGHRHGASTSSQVTVTLTGSVWETEPHHLTDPDKLLFERGAVDMFLLTTPFSLGELQSIRLWHDNSGKHPAWYINKVMVQDLETGQKWHFLCSSWLAIDIGECTLDKVFPVATEKDLKGFRNLFFMKTAKDLCDGHIWYSVVSRPPSSNFTCVQRVSCCFSLLLCTMLTSIMFWGIPTNPSEQTMEMGSIKFTWQQVMIGIQSSIIMFPINLLIVSIFRFTRPRKKIQEEESDEQHKPETPPQEKGPCDSFPQWCPQTDITVALIVRDLKRIVRSLAKATRTPIPKEVLGSGKTDISTLLSLVDDIIRQQDFSSGRFWVGDAQNERFSLYSVYQHYLYKQLQNVEKELRLLGPSRFSSPEGYGQAVQQVRGMKGLLEPHLPSSSTRDQSSCGSGPAEDSGGGGRKCCQGGLPWWFVIVGWILVAATSGVSAYFTMMYGLTYGKDRSISWLISTMVSFFESLLITQPIKVLGFAIFFALVVKAVDNDDDDDYINMARDKALTYSDDPDDVRISRRDSTCSFYQPPPSSDVEKMMDNMIKEKKVFALIKEILIYVGFLCTLLITAYGQRDPNAYFLTQHIEQTFSSGISDSMSIKDVLTWANFNLLDNLFGQRPGFITDGKSKLVGSARLRQVRVQKGSCQTAACMRSSVPDCNAPYSWEAEDTGSYGPGWSRSTYSSGAESRLTPWQYQSQSSLRAHPVWGSVAMYRGGGFVVDLGSDLQNASSVLQDLFESMWLDVYTRAVFVEFTVYNANVNLFCIVTLMLETSAVGAFQYRSELQNVRIYQTTDSTYVLVFEVFYFLFILYYMFLQCKRLKQHKWKYFKSKGNLLELTIILLSWSALSMFIKKTVQGEQELKYYQGHKDQFPSFYETASADAVLGYIVAFLVLLASIKLCHLLRFNSRLKWFTSTLWRAWNDIANLFVIIIVVLLAYSLACNLLFGWKLYTYKTLIDAIMAMVSLQLGMFNYDEVLDLSPVLGTFIIVSFVTFMTFIVLNIFISVILKAFSLERQNHEPSEEEEVVDLMLKKTSNFFGIKTQKK